MNDDHIAANGSKNGFSRHAINPKHRKFQSNEFHLTANSQYNSEKKASRKFAEKSPSPEPSIISDKDESAEEDDSAKPSSIAFFASNTTFHGISHFLGTGTCSFRKILWFSAFAGSLAGLLTQVHDRYQYYQSHPHVTKLDEQEASIMFFPAITICNMNPFRLTRVTTDDYYYIGERLLGLFNADFSLKQIFRDNRTWPFVMQKIRRILNSRNGFRPMRRWFNMFEFYDRTGHEKRDMVKSCRYRGEECKENQWVPTFTRYGKCYTFNSGKNKIPVLTTLKGGVDNGLEILLDTEQDNYMPVWNETDEISVEAGFKVQIHSQDEPPFIHELGFGISPGFQSLVATQEQRITFLPKPYGECESGRDKSKHFYFPTYSISACRITCETEYIFNKCQCRMIHMPGNYSFCSAEFYKCADKWLDFLVKSDEKACVCDTPCNVTRYNLQMSTLQIPSTQALSYLAAKYSKKEDYVRNNFAKLNIFFEALNYETIDQKKAYELPGLFGDIGGQMGLFIGASILTILELIDYLYEVVKDKTWGKKERRRKQKGASPEIRTEEHDLDDLQGHSTSTGYEMHHNEKRAFTPYNYLAPLPEYACVQRRLMNDQASNPPAEMNHGVKVDKFGNSYGDEYGEVRLDPKRVESSFSHKPSTLQPLTLARGRKESLSYNDLSVDFGNHWSSRDDYNERLSAHPGAVSYTMPPTFSSTGKYFRPLESSVYPNSNIPKHATRSPTRANGAGFMDFPSTKETEIH